MIKKVIILSFSIFILTGCEAVYNVNISDNINDELTINNYNISSWNEGQPSYKESIDEAIKTFNLTTNINTPGYPDIIEKLDGYNYYKKELISTQDNYGIRFTYDYNSNDYKNNILLYFFDYMDFKNSSSSFKIDTGNSKGILLFNNYPALDKLTINISSDYYVNNNNADEINNNIYTWYLTKDNYLDKRVIIELDKTKTTNYDRKNNILNITILFLGLGLLIAIFIIYTKVKNSNN